MLLEIHCSQNVYKQSFIENKHFFGILLLFKEFEYIKLIWLKNSKFFQTTHLNLSHLKYKK